MLLNIRLLDLNQRFVHCISYLIMPRIVLSPHIERRRLHSFSLCLLLSDRH